MDSLPFALKVPGKDSVTVTRVSSTTFRFHGLLRLEEHTLLIDWSGTAEIDEVGMLNVTSEVLSLPHESLALPLGLVRRIALRGGWWRPCLEIAGNDLETLRVIPSEDRGQVRLWISRRDRQLAARFVAEVLQRKQSGRSSRELADRASPAESTPPNGIT
jgi:hypothetical protein